VIAFEAMRIKKKYIWLSILLPGLFIGDILYGGLVYYNISIPINPGIILRGAVFLCSLNMILHHHYFLDGKFKAALLFMSLSVVPSIVVGGFSGYNLYTDLIGLSKALYLPYVAALFIIVARRYEIKTDEILQFVEITVYLIGISMLVSRLLNIRHLTYGTYAFGDTGIFWSQNSMSITYAIGFLVAVYRLIILRFSIIRSILLLISILACLQIGTRASLISVLCAAVTIPICYLYSRDQKQSFDIKAKKWSISLFIILSLLLAFSHTLSTHQQNRFNQNKLDSLRESALVRSLLMRAAMDHISNRPFWLNLTGEGTDGFRRSMAIAWNRSGYDTRMVEIDWLDLFGCYGITFPLLIHVFLLKILIALTYRFLKYRISLYGLFSAALAIFLIHSALAGHCIVNPIPSTLVAALLSIYYLEVKQKGRI